MDGSFFEVSVKVVDAVPGELRRQVPGRQLPNTMHPLRPIVKRYEASNLFELSARWWSNAVASLTRCPDPTLSLRAARYIGPPSFLAFRRQERDTDYRLRWQKTRGALRAG